MQVSKQFQRINQRFPMVKNYLITYLFLEAHLFIVSGAKTATKSSMQVKKLKNVKELLNLFIAEYVQDSTELANLRRLNMGYFRLLSDFLLFKLKSTDTFSMLIENDIIDDKLESPDLFSPDDDHEYSRK